MTKNKTTNTENSWVWMPHAGHFILSNKCRFHLNTYLPSGYIVSTVGELWNERSVREIHASIYDKEWHEKNNHLKGDLYDAAYMEKFGFEDIGYQRKYETMVFKARRNTNSKWQCCPYEIRVEDDVDVEHYNDGLSAREGHMILCKKWDISR